MSWDRAAAAGVQRAADAAAVGLALGITGIALAYALPHVPLLGRWIDRRDHAASAQVAFRFNSFIGLALAERLLGAQGLQLIAVLIGVNVVFGFLFPGIAWQAHLGGLVTGAIVAFGYTAASRRRRGAGGRR